MASESASKCPIRERIKNVRNCPNCENTFHVLHGPYFGECQLGCVPNVPLITWCVYICIKVREGFPGSILIPDTALHGPSHSLR